LRIVRHADQWARPHGLLRALIDNLEQPVRLEPFSKFPVVRDLATDRSVIFENLKAVKAWVPIDGTYDLGPGPRMTPKSRRAPIPFPAAFPAAAAWKPARSLTKIPASWARPPSRRCACSTRIPRARLLKRERLAALMGDGGIQECGYAQNCVEVCPKDIPLTKAISEVAERS
jgi:succinate dehydrogenase / fumarate reductase, iron-sulfur subunit